MQKWEYCAISGIRDARTDEYSLTTYPSLFRFTEAGLEQVKIRKVGNLSEEDNLAKMIAELGAEGWELVSSAPMLYFKRPVADG